MAANGLLKSCTAANVCARARLCKRNARLETPALARTLLNQLQEELSKIAAYPAICNMFSALCQMCVACSMLFLTQLSGCPASRDKKQPGQIHTPLQVISLIRLAKTCKILSLLHSIGYGLLR